MKKIILLLCSALVLSGCVAPMTKSEVNAAKYDELPSDYQDQIKGIMDLKLKDPESAKYRFFDPRKAYTASTRHFAYVVPVGVNAKNSYGGYTGFQMFYFSYFDKRFKDVTTGVSLEAVQWSDDVK